MTISLRQMTAPITQADLDGGVMAKLRKIQGNILRSHGRNRLVLLVLSIDDGASPGKVSAALRKFSVDHVTSGAQQLDQTRTYRLAMANSDSSTASIGQVFGSAFLTALGYQRLKFPTDNFRDASFISGMKTSGPDRLGDPAVANWEGPYRRPVHGMLLLAGDDAAELERVVAEVTADFKAAKVSVSREDGDVPRNKKLQLVDPFGFAHGLSQPLFFEDDLEKVGVSGKIDPADDQWNPQAGPSLVLAQDPLVGTGSGLDDDALGSYMVFRKLEMDPSGFDRRVGKLAQRLNDPAGSDRAAALVVGRHKNGSPLVAADVKTKAPPNPATFNYASDTLGRMCPLHSHVRKSNPRVMLADDREHRIARRGVNYSSASKQGMLFMCYQAKIARQFEFIQRRWLNDPRFPGQGIGRDPVAGAGTPVRGQRWPLHGATGDVRFNIGGYVRMMGGDYFFAPSIPFLTSL